MSSSAPADSRQPTADSYVQPDRHDQIDESASLLPRLEQPGAQRADELQDEVLGLRALQAVPEELGVEADLEGLALEGDRQRLAGLADVGRLGRDLDGALAEAQAE